MLYAFLYLRYINISLVILLYYSNNHVTGACTRHVPWIQAAMDSDSSAREAALHKRRERDQDHCDRDSSEEREARLSRCRHIRNIRSAKF